MFIDEDQRRPKYSIRNTVPGETKRAWYGTANSIYRHYFAEYKNPTSTLKVKKI